MALRAVKANDTSKRPTRSKTVAAAARGGDQRELLVAMRNRLAKAVSDPETHPRDLAALSRRLHEIFKEIEVIDQRAKEEAHADGAAPDEAWDPEAL